MNYFSCVKNLFLKGHIELTRQSSTCVPRRSAWLVSSVNNLIFTSKMQPTKEYQAI